MLCCAVLCCAVLCCAVLCCAVLCCALVWCASPLYQFRVPLLNSNSCTKQVHEDQGMKGDPNGINNGTTSLAPKDVKKDYCMGGILEGGHVSHRAWNGFTRAAVFASQGVL